MPGWQGFSGGCPQWYSDVEKFIEGSIEPSGLQLYAKMPQHDWDNWLELFKEKLTASLGYPVGEPEDGYDFIYQS